MHGCVDSLCPEPLSSSPMLVNFNKTLNNACKYLQENECLSSFLIKHCTMLFSQANLRKCTSVPVSSALQLRICGRCRVPLTRNPLHFNIFFHSLQRETSPVTSETGSCKQFTHASYAYLVPEGCCESLSFGRIKRALGSDSPPGGLRSTRRSKFNALLSQKYPHDAQLGDAVLIPSSVFSSIYIELLSVCELLWVATTEVNLAQKAWGKVFEFSN